MSIKCYAPDELPLPSRLYRDFFGLGESSLGALGTGSFGAGEVAYRAGLSMWYPTSHGAAQDWAARSVVERDQSAVAEVIAQSSLGQGYGPKARQQLARLGAGAHAVITGQQAGLFGGPLLTLLKAATTIARAAEAETLTGVPHVPIFWVAGEDHDLAEANESTFAGRTGLETLRLPGLVHSGAEVGSIPLGPGVAQELDRVRQLLNHAPVVDLLDRCYGASGATFGSAFGAWLTELFAGYGLLVIDPSTRPFHALGRPTLRFALEHAAELEVALLARSQELRNAGYHAQVLVKPGGSLLFLLVDGQRLPLRRSEGDVWKAGSRTYSHGELLEILAREPERLSPNALLRPVFQDTLFRTAAYVGGPAEVAYFAQSEVLYRNILGYATPILPRFSATLVEPEQQGALQRFELEIPNLVRAGSADVLAQLLGARSMPVEAKRLLATAGNTLDTELQALTTYFTAMDAGLGRSTQVAGNKMRYQMNRLRRLGASFQLQRERSLQRQADLLMTHLFPAGHLQERVLAGAQLLASAGDHYESRIDLLVTAARTRCAGHTVLSL